MRNDTVSAYDIVLLIGQLHDLMAIRNHLTASKSPKIAPNWFKEKLPRFGAMLIRMLEKHFIPEFSMDGQINSVASDSVQVVSQYDFLRDLHFKGIEISEVHGSILKAAKEIIQQCDAQPQLAKLLSKLKKARQIFLEIVTTECTFVKNCQIVPVNGITQLLKSQGLGNNGVINVLKLYKEIDSPLILTRLGLKAFSASFADGFTTLSASFNSDAFKQLNAHIQSISVGYEKLVAHVGQAFSKTKHKQFSDQYSMYASSLINPPQRLPRYKLFLEQFPTLFGEINQLMQTLSSNEYTFFDKASIEQANTLQTLIEDRCQVLDIAISQDEINLLRLNFLKEKLEFLGHYKETFQERPNALRSVATLFDALFRLKALIEEVSYTSVYFLNASVGFVKGVEFSVEQASEGLSKQSDADLLETYSDLLDAVDALFPKLQKYELAAMRKHHKQNQSSEGRKTAAQSDHDLFASVLCDNRGKLGLFLTGSHQLSKPGDAVVGLNQSRNSG